MKKKLGSLLKQVFYFTLVLALIITTMPAQVSFATDYGETQNEENADEEVNEQPDEAGNSESEENKAENTDEDNQNTDENNQNESENTENHTSSDVTTEEGTSSEEESQTEDEEDADTGLLTGANDLGIALLALDNQNGMNIPEMFEDSSLEVTNISQPEYIEDEKKMKVTVTIGIDGVSSVDFEENPGNLELCVTANGHKVAEVEFGSDDTEVQTDIMFSSLDNYTIKAELLYDNVRTHVICEADEQVIIEQQEITVENQELVTIKANETVTKQSLLSYYDTSMFHGADYSIYESDSNKQIKASDDCLFTEKEDEYVPNGADTTYFTVAYEETTFFKEASYLVPYKVETCEFGTDDVVITLPENGYVINNPFSITVSYKMPNAHLAQKYCNKKYFYTEIVFSSSDSFKLDDIVTPEVARNNESDPSIINVVYNISMNNASEDKANKIGSLADKEFTCTAYFKGDSSRLVKEKEYTLEGTRQYERYNPEFNWDGVSSQYELDLNRTQNINLKLDAIDSFRSLFGYSISAPNDTDHLITITRANKGEFKTNICGTVDVIINIPKQLIFKEQNITRTIEITSPDAPEDIIQFNNKSWNNVKNSFYETEEGYWAGAAVQTSVKSENDYFNAAKVYTGLAEDCDEIPETAVGEDVPCALEGDTIQQYTFYIYNAGLRTKDTQNFKLGIDAEEPKNDSTGIQLSGATAINYSGDTTTYFNKLPKLSATFSDAQSGIDKIYISYVKDGRTTEQELTPTITDGVYQVSDTLEMGKYTNVKMIAKDHVGHEKVVDLYEGKQIIVDTEKPVVALQSSVRDRNYDGEWTNQQIQFALGVEECLSGIHEVKYAYVPNGKTVTSTSIQWTKITVSENGKYEASVGAENAINDLDATDANTVNSVIAEAILGVSPYDKDRQGTGSTTTRSATRNTVQALLRNGTFYFVATSKAQLKNDYDSAKQRVRLQQRDLSDGAMYVDQLPAETEWYNEKFVNNKPYLSFTYPNETQQITSDGECPAALSLHYKIENTTTADNVQKEFAAQAVGEEGSEEIVYDRVDGYPVNNEGEYCIYVWATDEASNRSATQKYIVKADYTAPTDVKLFVAGQDATKDADDKSVHYTQFFNSSVDISAEGNFDISGFDKFVVYEAHNPGDKGTSHSFDESNGSFSIGPNNRCFLYAEATDVAGNITEVRSEGFVVDNEAPIGAGQTELSITPEGANKNGFFNKDFNVNIEVNDSPTDHNSAALKQVSYMISNSSDHSNTETLFSFGSSAPSSGELESAENFSDTVTIKAADYESNTAYIELKSIDNSGNERVTTEELMIDVTIPEITITYDNNQALHDQYYQQNRTARVQVKELNFDPALVTFDITKDGQSIGTLTPATSSWTDDGDEHYTYITFGEDGDYTLTASCTDLADNESVYDTVDSFTIDKTKPEVTVTYDNETPWKDIYFNTARTATITIVEHNFDASDFTLTSEPAVMVSGWSNDGDTHRATIAFTNDGEYTYGINYVDLAGNEMAPFTTEHFKIDSVEPVVAISGVEDQSANAGDIIPVVTVEDEDFDQEGVTISLRNSKGKDIALTRVPSAIPNGSSYVLTNVTEQEDEIYYLTVAGTDLAGNTSELSYRFSLNRNGSTYDLSSMSDVVDRVYSNYSVMSDLSILEMNVDRIEKFSIYISRNGSMLESKEVSSRPSNLDENVIYYQVNVDGNDNLGYSYEYTIYQENFQPEGTYNIMFYSKDRAGNEVNNTLNDKGAEITFIVDNTAPKVVVEGVNGYELYAEDSMDVNVYVTDNFKLQQAEFYLVDINGDRVQTWDYMSLVNADSEIATLTIPSSETRQSLLFHAVDAAGNEVTSLPDEEDTPTNFLITTNIWLRFLNTPGAMAAAAAGTTVLAGGTCALYFRKRKKLKVVEAKEQ